MAGLDPGSWPTEETRHPASERYNARLGLLFFLLYLLAYGGYVIINAFWPTLMDTVVGTSLNWAVVSGLGLIVLAFALALLYAGLCRVPEDRI